MLHVFVNYLSDTHLNTEETTRWQESWQAYLTNKSQTISEEQHRVGEVWTDSESDDPEDRVDLTIHASLQSKAFQVGADAWRHTGVLTFSGNLKQGPKITYNRIKQHLEKKYCTKIAYGTIVQLCLPHNKRRLSACRYWGIAGLKSRQARKGFNVRLDIDAHWSCAVYKCLDYIQRKNGEDKLTLNRDDAAGFRLDTTYTHKQHKTWQKQVILN